MRASLAHYYEAYDRVEAQAAEERSRRSTRLTAIQRALGTRRGGEHDGFKRMQRCRNALNAMDRRGWDRSFHQRHFHDNFIRACARIFFKTDPPGSFARNHQRVLELNGWDTLAQEVLISTPRYFRNRAISFYVSHPTSLASDLAGAWVWQTSRACRPEGTCASSGPSAWPGASR